MHSDEPSGGNRPSHSDEPLNGDEPSETSALPIAGVESFEPSGGGEPSLSKSGEPSGEEPCGRELPLSPQARANRSSSGSGGVRASGSGPMD